MENGAVYILETMVRLVRHVYRARRIRTLLLLLSCGCLLVVINLAFGLNLMNSNFLYEAGDAFYNYNSILPLPPFMRKNAEQREIERKHRERMIVFQHIFENHARSRKKWKSDNQQVCKHPHLDLKHDTNRHAYYHLPPLNCSGENLFHLSNSEVQLNKTVLGNRELGKCIYLGIERVSDDYVTYTDSLKKVAEPYNIILQQDFIRIQCFLAGHSEEKPENVINDQPFFAFRRLLQDDVATRKNDLDTAKGNNYNNLDRNQTLDIQNKDNLSNSSFNKSILTNLHNSRNQSTGNITHGGSDHGNNSDIEVGVHHADYEEYGYDYDNRMNQDFGIESTDSDFDQFLLHVHPKPSVFDRISKTKPGKFSTRMNVLIFGLDSMSQLSYRRKLPKTMKYLKDLKTVLLNGYNIVGDATTAALIPMLTGKTELELPEVRKSEAEAENLDVYPLVWNKFKEDGYATLFAEDEPSIGVFNLRLSGFQDQPTDHYMRTFWLALWESLLRSGSERYCTGKTPHHTYMLDYLKDFFVKYHNVSKFAFAFQSELSHWNNNPVEYIDEDLTAFLHFLNTNGFLDNTLLIIMGDHGARYSSVRNTVQGKLEERLPMMAFRFPPWFEKKFPKAMQNLRKNIDRLATPFDIHETLLDIMDYSRIDVQHKLTSRSMSLLQEIPLNRTCASAGIDMHWCACLTQVHVSSDDKFVHDSAQAVLSYINKITHKTRRLCSVLKLRKVLTAMLVIPNEKVLRFKSSKDDDQRIANFTNDINMDKAHYQITIETDPNKGIYEATVEVDFRNETYHYNVTPELSRLDMYGDQPKCVQKKYPDLRKYCFCNKEVMNITSHGSSKELNKMKNE